MYYDCLSYAGGKLKNGEKGRVTNLAVLGLMSSPHHKYISYTNVFRQRLARYIYNQIISIRDCPNFLASVSLTCTEL